MKKFRFTLQTVLEVRRMTEEKIQKEFSAVLQEKTECLEALKNLNSGRDELVTYQLGQRKIGKQTAVTERWFSEKYADFSYKAMLKKRTLREIEYRLEVKRRELVKASSDTKVLEKLEENQLTEYIKNAAKEEQSFLDEIAQYQGVRDSLNAA